MKEEVALARSEIYRLLSMALGYPDRELMTGLSEASFISQFTECAKKLPSYGSIKRFIQSLETSIKRYGDNIFPTIISEYLALFGQDHEPKCSLYELGHLSRGPLFMNTGILADIAGFYRAFGLEVADGSKDRVDHISIELEFMYFLALKEAFILKNGEQSNLKVCIEAQKKFLLDHLGRWAGIFHERIKVNTNSSFYCQLTRLLDKFVAQDAKTLGIKPEKIKRDQFKLDDVSERGKSWCGGC
jgi:putative dimethyl sulfoxide reductase chaperone